MSESQTNSTERRHELLFPRALSLPTRLHLWLRGFADAKKGRVSISAFGWVTSSFCRRLVQYADLRIRAEWQECNGAMFELRPSLESALRKQNEIQRRIERLEQDKAFKIEDANIVRAGDEAVSEHLKLKRRNRRVGLIESEFGDLETQLYSNLEEALNSVSSILAKYQDAKDISETHENLVRLEYLTKLTCYSQGASRWCYIDPHYINDEALTRQPREENEELFGACLHDALEKVSPSYKKAKEN